MKAAVVTPVSPPSPGFPSSFRPGRPSQFSDGLDRSTVPHSTVLLMLKSSAPIYYQFACREHGYNSSLFIIWWYEL